MYVMHPLEGKREKKLVRHFKEYEVAWKLCMCSCRHCHMNEPATCNARWFRGIVTSVQCVLPYGGDMCSLLVGRSKSTLTPLVYGREARIDVEHDTSQTITPKHNMYFHW